MSSMQEMATEYRKNTARIAMRIKELESQSSPDLSRINTLKSMLAEMRAAQRQLSSYYDSDRDPEITMSGYITKRRKSADDD